MESPRISLARVLELGVCVSWREALSIAHEAVARAGATEGAGPARVTAESCLLTRGGDVVLAGTAAQARPEVVVRLLDDLLASCSNPGRFSGAVADGTALDIIEEFSHDTTPKRRRVEVASVALRGLTADVDATRARADADQQRPSADFDDSVAAPTPAASPTDFPRPWVTVLAPPPAIQTIDDQTFALLEDSAVGDAEVRGPGLDPEDLIAAVEAAPPPAASTSPDPTVALLEDAAVVNKEIRGLGLDLEDLIAAVEAALTPAALPSPDPTVALLDDAAVVNEEISGLGLDLEDLIAAVDAAPAPAASPTDVPWPSVTALAPPSALPPIDDQTFALLEDSAVGDAEVPSPGLDLEDLIAAVDAAPAPAASPTDVPWPAVTALAPPAASPPIPEQTFALLEDAAVDDAEVHRPGLDLEDLIAAVDASPAPPAIPDQTFALLGDAAVDDAEVRGPGLDLEDLIAAVDAAPAPAAAPTDGPWPSVTALAPPSAMPTIPEQTFALLGDAAVGDAELGRPGLDPEDQIVAVDNADDPRSDVRPARRRRRRRRGGRPAGPRSRGPDRRLTALAAPAAMPTTPDQTFALLGDAAVGNAEVTPGLDHEDLIAAVEAAREWTAHEDAVAALAIGMSPAQGTRPSVTLRPASFSMDLPSAKPLVNAVWTYVWGGYASSCDRVRRSSPVALVCSVLALATGGILGLQLPETRWSAVEPSEPAIEPPEFGAPVGLDGHTPRARRDPALLHEVADTPSVPPLVARNAPRGSPGIEGRSARFTEVPDSYVWSMPRPARRPETPATNTATVAGSRSLSTTSAAAALLAPAAANSAGVPPPVVDPSSVVASPGATASSPAQTFGSASNNVPVNVVARSPDRELETRAIENVLGRYRIAFNKLDAGAALAVWPTVNEKTLANAFERLESHDMSFRSCQIELISVIAEAACSGSARYVPKVGSRTPKTEERRWRFMLRKARSGWLIESVDAS